MAISIWQMKIKLLTDKISIEKDTKIIPDFFKILRGIGLKLKARFVNRTFNFKTEIDQG